MLARIGLKGTWYLIGIEASLAFVVSWSQIVLRLLCIIRGNRGRSISCPWWLRSKSYISLETSFGFQRSQDRIVHFTIFSDALGYGVSSIIILNLILVIFCGVPNGLLLLGYV